MDPTSRARRSLAGLHLGDCFGEQFFVAGPEAATLERIAQRRLPEPPWPYTDDSAQAAVLTEHVVTRGRVVQDRLADELASEHARDPMRGYGAGARRLLAGISEGADWRTLSAAAFSGSGSFGNGAAMRVAPLGAWFGAADRAAEEAARSAEVTHAHVDGIAGAVAVAVAAAAFSIGSATDDVWRDILAHTPDSLTREMLRRARDLGACSVRHAAEVLGTGARISAPDTVPFCVWSALAFRTDFEEAMWNTVSGLGDRDTTCAIVGGIVASAPGLTLPDAWLRRAEPLPSGPER